MRLTPAPRARAQHFINDYEKNKSFSGFPALGIDWQKMESPFLRKSLGMKARFRRGAAPSVASGPGCIAYRRCLSRIIALPVKVWGAELVWCSPKASLAGAARSNGGAEASELCSETRAFIRHYRGSPLHVDAGRMECFACAEY